MLFRSGQEPHEHLRHAEVAQAPRKHGDDGDDAVVGGRAEIRIPVKTGRNISVVIEAAAMNYRAKEMGFDATRLFEERLTNLIAQNEVPNA